MSEREKDRELGMGCPISRRDFLNGVAVGVGGAFAGETLSSAGVLDSDGGDGPEKAPEYYPPALTGMRGNHDGSYTYAHRLRDGGKWDAGGPAAKVDETYDLVVVGGGISGLASAYFFRKAAGNSARILILDNHDDFGGHAKRNEFTAGGRMLLSYGGTQSIESPGLYSAVAKELIAEIGIDVEKFYKAYDRNLYKKLGTAAFFDKETFGEDRLLTGFNTTPWPEFLAKAPLSDVVRRDIARVYTEKVDYMDGLSLEQKQRKLGVDQLRGLSDEVLQGDAGRAEIFSDVSARFVSEWVSMRCRRCRVTARRTITNHFCTRDFRGWDCRSWRRKSPTFFIFRMGMRRWRGCWCAR